MPVDPRFAQLITAMESTFKLPLYIKFALIAIGAFAIISALYIAQGIIIPLIFSGIIAIVLSPIVNYFTSKGMNKILGISLTLLLIFSIVVLVTLIVSSQANMPEDSYNLLLTKFQLLVNQAEVWISKTFNISLVKLKTWEADLKSEAMTSGRTLLGQTLKNIGSVMIVMVLIPVYIFMILYYEPLLIEFLHKLFTSSKHKELKFG